MISLGGLVNQKAFGKFEMGKVISNPFATAFIKEAEGEDHEVSMGQNQLDTIIKMATELKAKMGENEKEIPAWIQDHISKAENYISQAAGNYHEYGVSEANTISAPGQWVAYLSMTRGKKLLKTFDTARGAKQYLSKNVDKLLGGANVESVGIMTKKQWDEREAKYAIESIKEESPCWKGYKQVGMKDKGGRQVPNCVPNESVVNEAPNKLKHTISKKEWSKIPKYNKHIGMDGVHYIMKYDDKIGTYLQGVQIVDESVNEAPNTGEKIQNLNNRIKALKDKMAATKSSEQKNLIQQRLKNALQTLSNYKKQNISKEGVVKEATYNFGKEEYTKKNLTPTQIQDLAFGYVQAPITKLVGKTLGHRVNLANDLARLTGTKQLDAKARGKEAALIMVLLKNKLVSKEEYIQMYKDLIEKHQQVIKYLRNASPEMRNTGGAARAAAKDMKGEFDID
jgi:hypothetical protein